MADRTAPPPTLVRAIGPVSLTAIAVNGMIGAGIFALPATVAKLLGPASAFAYLTAGLATLLIALCFAEVGSLFEGSGGPYLYARTAFGPFVGFEVGWMFALARLTGTAAISNAFADYAGYFAPAMAHGFGRPASITVVVAGFAWVNYLGIKPGVRVVNILTVGKLVPLLVFCGAGLFFIDFHTIAFARPPAAALGHGTLLLLFAFSGFEFASVPTGEVVNPRRALPVAIVTSVAGIVILFFLIQVVALGALPTLGSDATPLASAAGRFLGPAGGLALAIGAILSTCGTISASILVGSRMVYALAADGQMPRALARMHPRYRTPTVSIAIFALAGWALAISGTFAFLAAVSSLARLIYYTATCLAVPVLRRKMPNADRRFTLPGGPLIPILGLGACAVLLTGSSLREASIAGVALAAGPVVYWLSTWGLRRKA